VAVTADATQCQRMIDGEIRSALVELSEYQPGEATQDAA
jgi:hypothetical protein